MDFCRGLVQKVVYTILKSNHRKPAKVAAQIIANILRHISKLQPRKMRMVNVTSIRSLKTHLHLICYLDNRECQCYSQKPENYKAHCCLAILRIHLKNRYRSGFHRTR